MFKATFTQLTEVTRQAVEEITAVFTAEDFSDAYGQIQIEATGNVKLTATGFWIELEDKGAGNLFWVSPSYPEDAAVSENFVTVVDVDDIY